jgi:AcrR family transcriptional regulator
MVTQAQETTAVTTSRARMTGKQRREQLLEVGRKLFADKGFEATTVEEIAAKAGVSKPVVYEHFGGKEGLYAVVVDREIRSLLDGITGALTSNGHARRLLEQAALALLDYVENSTDGFRILVRDSPVAQATGTFSSLIGDVATQVEHLLADQFKRQNLDPKIAPIYARMLVGMVALTGQHWLDTRSPAKTDVAAHLVNLAWNGLSGLERRPTLGRTAPADPAAGHRTSPTGRPASPAAPARPVRAPHAKYLDVE